MKKDKKTMDRWSNKALLAREKRLTHEFNFNHMKKIFLVGQKLDLGVFLKKGLERNPITKKIQFNNKIIENLDYRFLKFLSKYSESSILHTEGSGNTKKYKGVSDFTLKYKICKFFLGFRD